MNQKTIDKIRTAGLESYVDNDFRKSSKRTNQFLVWAFLLGGVFLSAIGIGAMATESLGTGVFLTLLGLGSFFMAWLFKIPGKTNPGTDYKDELTKRHGDYKQALKEIETQLTTETVGKIDDGLYATSDWLVVLCSQQGSHFIHKSEIASILGFSGGTEIICDNGQVFNASFNNGDFSWDEAFLILAAGNPFMLSHGDFITTPDGELAPIENDVKNGDRTKLVVEQFLSNKESGVIAHWYSELMAEIEDDSPDEDEEENEEE